MADSCKYSTNQVDIKISCKNKIIADQNSRQERNYMNFVKKVARKSLVVMPYVILIAVGVHFSSQALADWHNKTFIEPIVNQTIIVKK